MSRVVRKEPCPSCRSMGMDNTGDNLNIYDDGHAHCFACGFNRQPNGIREERDTEMATAIEQLPYGPLIDRGVDESVAELYGVRVEYSPATREQVAYYSPVYKNGGITGWKCRKLPKQFSSTGDCRDPEPFGINLYSAGRKMAVVCEGEEDAMAAFQMFQQQGKNYLALACRGTEGWRKQLEFYEKFEHVVVCFDMDEPGKKAAQEFAESLTPGKAKIMTYTGAKDPNEMLLQGRSKDFLLALNQARSVRPDGIVAGDKTWEILAARKPVDCIPYPDGWDTLNELTYGVRLGELDTWTSGSGMGKTQILRELQYHLFKATTENIGVIALEEPLADSVEAIMSVHLGKRLHLPDVRATVSDDERYTAWLETVGTGRFAFYDHFGSVAEDSLINKIRYLAHGEGCKYIFLDHLSIVVSEFADEGDERKRIDAIMTKLKKLTQELGIWIGLVVHLRKTSGGTSFEEGGVPNLDDLRGSGSIKQLSNSVYALSRNQQHPDPIERNTSQLHVLKCRFTGRTGPADRLTYNQNTGRMFKAAQPDNEGM